MQHKSSGHYLGKIDYAHGVPKKKGLCSWMLDILLFSTISYLGLDMGIVRVNSIHTLYDSTREYNIAYRKTSSIVYRRLGGHIKLNVTSKWSAFSFLSNLKIKE